MRDDLEVRAPAVLTIHAGATILGLRPGLRITIHAGARLVAQGTRDLPISLAGPAEANAVPVDVALLAETSTAPSDESVLSHVHLRDGGPVLQFGTLEIRGCWSRVSRVATLDATI